MSRVRFWLVWVIIAEGVAGMFSKSSRTDVTRHWFNLTSSDESGGVTSSLFGFGAADRESFAENYATFWSKSCGHTGKMRFRVLCMSHIEPVDLEPVMLVLVFLGVVAIILLVMLHQSSSTSHKLGDLASLDGERPPPVPRVVYFFAACAAINSCNLGFDIGVSTSAGPLLQEDMHLSDSKLGIVMGCVSLFAVPGAFVASSVSDNFGRRRTFALSAFVFVCGLYFLCTAVDFRTIMIGRAVVGLGVGFGLGTDPVYIAEISPPHVRGFLVTWSEIGTNVGIVLGFASFTLASLPLDVAWRFMFALGGVLPCLMLVLVALVMPESPRWLLRKGRVAEAEALLRRLHPPGVDIAEAVGAMQKASAEEDKVNEQVTWASVLFPNPALRRMLIIGVGIQVCQEMSGIDCVQYFLVFILKRAGLEGPSQLSFLMALGLIKILYILVAGELFDRLGRRPLLLTSCFGMIVSFGVLGMNFKHGSSPSITVLALAFFLGSFSIGMGPGACLLPSEIFPNAVRAKAVSLATIANCLSGVVMTSSVLSVVDELTWTGWFTLQATVVAMIAAFIYHYVPETKGRTLEDMQSISEAVEQEPRKGGPQ